MEQQQSDYGQRTQNGHSFSGSDVNIYAALVIASAIDLYLKTGMKATRGVTVKSMCERAADYTKQQYKGKKGLAKAVIDLRNFADTAKVLPKAEVNPRKWD